MIELSITIVFFPMNRWINTKTKSIKKLKRLCNTPRFVSRCLSGSSSHARFRLRGVLVIARGGYLSGFGPKTFIFLLFFLSLKLKIRNLLSLPHSLEAQLLSFPSNPSSQLGTRLHCMLEALDELEEYKPTLYLLLAFSSLLSCPALICVSVSACCFCSCR